MRRLGRPRSVPAMCRRTGRNRGSPSSSRHVLWRLRDNTESFPEKFPDQGNPIPSAPLSPLQITLYFLNFLRPPNFFPAKFPASGNSIPFRLFAPGRRDLRRRPDSECAK
jgi:hypothetical protein